MVVRALPDTVQEAQGRVKELSAELAPLEVQRAQIERQASMWRAFVAWSGLAMLVTQFVLFARLTYWELSWDVMEPISYFSGQLVVRPVCRCSCGCALVHARWHEWPASA